MGQHVDMGSPSNKAVHVFSGADVKEDIDAMDYLLSDNRIYHLSLYFATIV